MLPLTLCVSSFFISVENSLPARVAILATTMLTLMNKAANAREVELLKIFMGEVS